MFLLKRIGLSFLIICSLLLANHTTVLAIPGLPSSFYGKVKLNTSNVPDGTAIQAFIGDVKVAEGYSQTYQGDSVYSLDIPGDNSETTVIDGGREGDTITFKVGGLLAIESGTWHTATNVQLDLTVTSVATPKPPRSTPTPIPTQTAIIVIQPSTIPPTLGFLISPTPTISSIATHIPAIPSFTPEPTVGSDPDQVDQNEVPASNGRNTSWIILLVAILIIGIIVFILLMRKRSIH